MLYQCLGPIHLQGICQANYAQRILEADHAPQYKGKPSLPRLFQPDFWWEILFNPKPVDPFNLRELVRCISLASCKFLISLGAQPKAFPTFSHSQHPTEKEKYYSFFLAHHTPLPSPHPKQDMDLVLGRQNAEKVLQSYGHIEQGQSLTVSSFTLPFLLKEKLQF